MHQSLRSFLALALLLSVFNVGFIGAPNDDTSAAVQQVIQRSNDEQVQALAARDTSLMADTLTAEHYQELVQINQNLLAHGVTSISLVKLEWGSVAVNGSTATATTYETWGTTFADGSTELSLDRNDYRLVLDGGAWKIAADDHPAALGGAPGASPPPAHPVPPTLPDGSSTQSTSHNWSGYAATTGTFTSVTGTWTVPQLTGDGTFGVDAAWVGIGGVRTRDLIQAGTQQTVVGAGRSQYQAWIELLPAPSRPVPLAVHGGDSITVSIEEEAMDQWLIAFTNNTTGQTYQTERRYASSHSSAEWIEEAPSTTRGGVLPLASFGTVQFSDGSTVKDGQTMSIAAAHARAITMVGSNDQPLAVPSDLNADGSSFSVSRTDAPAVHPNSRRGN